MALGLNIVERLARARDDLRMGVPTIALQWIEESINAVSWLCFAIASKKIYEYTPDNFGVK